MAYVCSIPKLFHKADIFGFMKLTRPKLVETLRVLNDGKTTYQARKVARISVRRVYQIRELYDRTGSIPEIGKKAGRPAKPIEQWEIDIVREAYALYRVSADTLERLIERDYNQHIPHNKIHKIMLQLKLARQKDKKDIRKKKCKRYEREHSLTLIHIDWYYDPSKEQWVYAVIDDASRRILALIETNSPTTEASITGIQAAMNHGRILQCISDHGSQFISNTGGGSKFATFLENNKIHQIFCRIKHPQANGKIEKWFDCYKQHRHAFQTAKDFLHWYNQIRPHRSLNFDILETPAQAFIRKRRITN